MASFEKYRTSLERLAEIIEQQDPKILIERKKRNGVDLWVGGYREQGFPLAPTIGLSDNWAMIGAISPAQVLRFFRLQRGDECWQAPDRLARLVDEADGVVKGFAYVNSEPLARMVATSLPLVAALARNSFPQLDIDLTQLPEIERMVTGLFPGTSVVSVNDAGVHVLSRSPLP